MCSGDASWSWTLRTFTLCICLAEWGRRVVSIFSLLVSGSLPVFSCYQDTRMWYKLVKKWCLPVNTIAFLTLEESRSTMTYAHLTLCFTAVGTKHQPREHFKGRNCPYRHGAFPCLPSFQPTFRLFQINCVSTEISRSAQAWILAKG